MKLIVKIGLIALLLMFNYQGVDADIVSSAIDRYATTTEHQDNMASDHGTLDTMSFTHSLLTGQQQVLAKLMPDDPRIRRAEELQQNFLKILIGRFSLREEILATDRAKIFPSNPIHCVFPACHYFVFNAETHFDLINRYKFSCFIFSGSLQSVGVGIELSFF